MKVRFVSHLLLSTNRYHNNIKLVSISLYNTPSSMLSDNSLYIIMELIDGAPLSEHFNSLKEKKQRFSEERIWKIYIQVRE